MVCTTQAFEALAREGLGLALEPGELALVAKWFGDAATLPGREEEEQEEEGKTTADTLTQQQQQQIDVDLFLQQFWALGEAAKARRRKEEAQERFLRVLASRGPVASSA